jgi:zinc D-Ala-D-Ala carboxypeptidase
MTYLSPNFQLAEFTRSAEHPEIDNSPPPSAIEMLKQLCVEILEPLRVYTGPIRISSGYRCPALNAAVGGQPTSEHLSGCAADIEAVDPTFTPSLIISFLVDSGLSFDQLIDETGSSGERWTHVSIARPGMGDRKQTLVIKDGVTTQFAII